MHTKLPLGAGQASQQLTGPDCRRDVVSDAAAVIVLVKRLEPDQAAVTLQLPLTAEQRSVLRGRRRTSCGREVVLQLPRDGALQPGDQLTDAQQSVLVEVTAAPEALMRVQAPTPLELMQAAYHLGNRHVALELHDQELLLPEDAVLASMLEGRGLHLSRCNRPFAPERGAYGGHAHG